MNDKRLYPTQAEIKHLEEIKKKYKIEENSLSSHTPTKKLYGKSEYGYLELTTDTQKT